MEFYGMTDDGHEVYQLTDKLGVSEIGELLELCHGEILVLDRSYMVSLEPDMNLADLDAAEWCKQHIFDLVNKTINGESFKILNDDDELQDDEPEEIEYKGYQASVFPNGTVQLYDELAPEIAKEITAICEALDYQLDAFIPFAELEINYSC